MSFEDIKIHRGLPIIGGWVQTPPNLETEKNRFDALEAVNDVDGTKIIRTTGPKGQEIFQLPGISPGEWYTGSPLPE